jgi:hypothetical protein
MDENANPPSRIRRTLGGRSVMAVVVQTEARSHRHGWYVAAIRKGDVAIIPSGERDLPN